MDETFPNRSGHDNDHDINDIKARLTAMEKYIYDIKVVQSYFPKIKADIESNRDDIERLKLDVRGLVHAVDLMIPFNPVVMEAIKDE